MSEHIAQGTAEAQFRTNLPAEVNTALNLLDAEERNVFLHMYSNMDPQQVNPLVERAANRIQALRAEQIESARLAAALATIGNIPQGPNPTTERDVPNQSATAPTGAFQAMDKDTRRRFLNDLRAIANYDGVIPNDAARKWTRDCDRYFSELARLTGYNSPDEAKVLHASGKLVKIARQRLEQREKHHNLLGTDNFPTWASFKEWLEWEFAEHLSTEKLYERYETLKQGGQSIQEYAATLQQVISDLDWDIPDPMLTQRFVTGTKATYRAKWAEERDQPKAIKDVIFRFAQYEQGRAIARKHEGSSSRQSDPMDIDKVVNAVDTHSTRSSDQKETRECHNCGKRGHLARACRKPKTEETKQKQKAAFERSRRPSKN